MPVIRSAKKVWLLLKSASVLANFCCCCKTTTAGASYLQIIPSFLQGTKCLINLCIVPDLGGKEKQIAEV